MIPFTIPQTSLNIGALLRPGDPSRDLAELERRFAEFVGTAYAAVVPSGRYGLYALYKYFGCEGKRVVAPAYTCIPATDAIRWAGARPWFVDIELETYNPRFDPALLTDSSQDVAAVTLSYLYGLMGPGPEVRKYLDFARARGIPVIEDAAIALGAELDGTRAGTIGNAAVFSLQSSKILSGWKGGIVTTNDSQLYAHLKALQGRADQQPFGKVFFNVSLMLFRRLLANPRLYGLTMYPLRRLTLNPRVGRALRWILGQNPSEANTGDSPKELPEDETRWPSGVQLRMVLASLRQLEAIISSRRTNAEFVTGALKDVPGVHLPPTRSGTRHAYGRLPLRIDGVPKTTLVREFAARGVEVGTYYPYVIPQTRHFGFDPDRLTASYPAALQAARETVLLPSHTSLTQRDLTKTVRAVRDIARTSGAL